MFPSQTPTLRPSDYYPASPPPDSYPVPRCLWRTYRPSWTFYLKFWLWQMVFFLTAAWRLIGRVVFPTESYMSIMYSNRKMCDMIRDFCWTTQAGPWCQFVSLVKSNLELEIKSYSRSTYAWNSQLGRVKLEWTRLKNRKTIVDKKKAKPNVISFTCLCRVATWSTNSCLSLLSVLFSLSKNLHFPSNSERRLLADVLLSSRVVDTFCWRLTYRNCLIWAVGLWVEDPEQYNSQFSVVS